MKIGSIVKVKTGRLEGRVGRVAGDNETDPSFADTDEYLVWMNNLDGHREALVKIKKNNLEVV